MVLVTKDRAGTPRERFLTLFIEVLFAWVMMRGQVGTAVTFPFLTALLAAGCLLMADLQNLGKAGRSAEENFDGAVVPLGVLKFNQIPERVVVAIIEWSRQIDSRPAEEPEYGTLRQTILEGLRLDPQTLRQGDLCFVR